MKLKDNDGTKEQVRERGKEKKLNQTMRCTQFF
jgi:hypothetical protein